MKKISSVHTHTSVGPKKTLNLSSKDNCIESDRNLVSVSLPDRTNQRTLLANTAANRKRGRGEREGDSMKKRIRWPWQ